MTLYDFKDTRWGPGMRAAYDGRVYPIAAVDFKESLVALSGVTLGDDSPTWVRCENIELLVPNATGKPTAANELNEGENA